MNKLTIAGHLGADPEVRYTSGGQKVTGFRVAVNSRKGGQDTTIWYRVSVWGENTRFDKMMTYLKKGSGVIVTGDLAPPQIYTDKAGQNQVSLEINADSLSFSPFGRPDKASGEQASPSVSSFGEQTYGDDYDPSAPFGASSGTGSAASAETEKQEVPF